MGIEALPPHLPTGDILFLSPLIISGDEAEEPYTADVLVSHGRIAQIGPGLSSSVPTTTRRVEGAGLVLCPGETRRDVPPGSAVG